MPAWINLTPGTHMQLNWRFVAQAIIAGTLAAVTSGFASLLASLVVFTIPGAASAFGNDPIGYLFLFIGLLTVPYILLILPIAFSISFYRAFSSESAWGSLMSNWRLFAMLVAIGAALWASLWLVGAHHA